MTTVPQSSDFNTLVADAIDHFFKGWDFSYLKGRWRTDSLPWDYARAVAKNN